MAQQRILLVDDEPRLLHVVGLYLSMEGFEVTEAQDGLEAMSKLDTETFDLAILDVMMPGVDGIEVCRHIRSTPQTQSMPVLVFTSLSADADVERALEMLSGRQVEYKTVERPAHAGDVAVIRRVSFAATPARPGNASR